MIPHNVEDEPALRDKAEVFKDRIHAGKMLAEKLSEYADKSDTTVVIAIPSGGVPVGHAIASTLRIPLDIILVRKIPVPSEPEAGFGSVTFDGSTFLNDNIVRSLNLSEAKISELIETAKKGLEERTRKFVATRREGLLSNIQGRAVILVDDGLASGYTMLASVESIRKRKPSKVLVAVPTASLSAVRLVSPKVDRLLCLNVRGEPFFAVADAYKEWHDIPEDEALKLIIDFRRVL